MAAGKTKVKILLNYYNQSGDQGYQIYDNSNDEEVEVFEPMLFVAYQIDESTNISGHYIFDTWSAASDTKLDSNTGASGEKGINGQSRNSGQVSYTKDHKSWQWSGRVGVSKEWDYKSLNFGGNWEGHFAEDNFVVSIGPQVYLDQAKSFNLQTEETQKCKGRFISAIDINASQLISQNDIFQMGYTFIHMNGMLSNISNSVKVTSNPYGNAFSRIEERMPSSRQRHALSTKWVHAFSDEIAVHGNYRYYTDDWGIDSNTAELGYRQSFLTDDDFLMVTLRYHAQTKADFWQQSFSTQKSQMTSDSDLAKLNSKRLGIHYSHLLADRKIYIFDFTDINLSSGLYYYDRSNNLNYYILQVGMSVVF